MAPDGRPVGFVTYAGAAELTPDDRLAIEPLGRLGHSIHALVWDDPSVRWEQYPTLVLRSTWDYHKKATAFAAWLTRIESLGCSLWNPPGLVRWNMDKAYLRDLSSNGIPITPTIWLVPGESPNLGSLLEANRWSRAVVKPTLSATAFLTWIVTPESSEADQAKLDEMLERGGVLLQRFEETITQGEWSLIFFLGRFSHAVLKVPSPGDFRVQKEYGGTAAPATAPARIVATAEQVLAQVRFPWLYARVDLVDSESGVRLMELEMLEPDLFLRHNGEAPARFAAAIKQSLQ